jgi:hypothetical protein
MKMTCSFSLMKLNTGNYKKALDTEMLKKLKEAVGVWIQAAITVIPVWSGASHGTFLKLASKIGMTFSISGGGGFPGMTGPVYGDAHSQGRLTNWGGAYIAEYSTTLWHLIYNEYNNANANPEAGHVYSRLIRPGPYMFQDKANAAFSAYIDNVRMPSPWAHLTLVPRQVS